MVLSPTDTPQRRDLASSLSLLQAKSVLFLLLLLTVDLHKRAATEFVFFSSGKISDAAFEAQKRSEGMIEHGYDFLEGWLAKVAYDAEVDSMYYCTRPSPLEPQS